LNGLKFLAIEITIKRFKPFKHSTENYGSGKLIS